LTASIRVVSAECRPAMPSHFTFGDLRTILLAILACSFLSSSSNSEKEVQVGPPLTMALEERGADGVGRERFRSCSRLAGLLGALSPSRITICRECHVCDSNTPGFDCSSPPLEYIIIPLSYI
jgi:hypothetical protein